PTQRPVASSIRQTPTQGLGIMTMFKGAPWSSPSPAPRRYFCAQADDVDPGAWPRPVQTESAAAISRSRSSLPRHGYADRTFAVFDIRLRRGRWRRFRDLHKDLAFKAVASAHQ